MMKFINNLPVQHLPMTEKVAITFNHFMEYNKMYFANGHEITTQYGFKRAVLEETKLTEKQIDKIINDYNRENITPDKYRKMCLKLFDLQCQMSNIERLAEFKKKHPLKYICAMILKK